MKKLVALLLCVAMVLSLAACGKTTPTPTKAPASPTTAPTEPAKDPDVTSTPTPSPIPEAQLVEHDEFEALGLGSKKYGEDYQSLYDQFGKDITLDDVVEDEDGAYIVVDGKKYQLGLDFLSFAMVYNNTPTETYKTADDTYAAWWRLYIQRWNYLLPEVPLYSNEYYDLYNSQITGVKEFPTNPYWAPASALIDWSSTKEDKSIIIGNTTELSGQFRSPSFGKSSPGAADNDIGGLISGLDTVTNTKEGGFVWNNTVVESHSEKVNDDGSKTFTIKIKNDLKFSDGSAVTAKNYVVGSVASLTPVYTEAASRKSSGLTVVGWEGAYEKYEGPGSEGVKYLAGLRLIDDYTFAFTVTPDYIPYYYDITYAAFGPSPLGVYIGNADIKDDGQGCYLTDDFYAKDADGKYIQAQAIKDNMTLTTAENYAKYPYSGAYVVQSFDVTTSQAVLVKNPYYKGNYEGATPKIEKVIYKYIVSKTQLEDFKAGGLDVISGITGGPETDEALELADNSNGKYVYTHYSRAGYGKLGFRCDYGAAQFTEVRQAIAYCMNRGQFAKDFTGGYGGVVDGPYYTGSWMYKAAVAQGMELDTYATSADSAIEVLVAGGWVYDKDGKEYKTGIRYKKIPGSVATEREINFKSVDGAYQTTKVGNDYYMPLVINWYGTIDNDFSDLLQTGFKSNANVTAAGMIVYNTLGDFSPMLDELYEQKAYGYYGGTPMYNAFNFATGFNSALYDYSWNMTINPDLYDDYSSYYIKDLADIYWMK